MLGHGIRNAATETYVHKELLLAAWNRGIIQESDFITGDRNGGKLDKDADKFLEALQEPASEVTPGILGPKR